MTEEAASASEARAMPGTHAGAPVLGEVMDSGGNLTRNLDIFLISGE